MKNVVVAKAFVINNEGKILAVRRSKTDERRPLQWDTPGGWLEQGEDITEATAREVEEEAGLKVNPHDLTLVFTKTGIRKPKNESMNVNWLFFVVRTNETEVKLSYEHDKAQWMTLDEALKEFEYDLHLEAIQHLKDNDLI